jgi:hypothetical protein
VSALSVAEALDRAADLIEPEGAWMQNALSKYDAAGNVTCMCALGALLNVRGASFEAADFLDTLLPQTRGGQKRPLAEWNDAPERTQAEVVAKLREAAALAREQGK